MMTMTPKLKSAFHHPQYADSDLRKSISQILDVHELCAIATLNEGSTSHIHTAYFAYDEHMDIYFISPLTDQHSINISKNASVAVAVWNPTRQWGESLQGLQIYGKAEVLGVGMNLVRGMTLYLKRFKDFSSIIKHPGEFAQGISSRMYVIRPTSLKLLDEPRFGRRNYIELTVHAE
jgi:uncharacterized protein